MTFPAALLGALIAAFHASLYHLIRGGQGRRWLFLLFLSAAGFSAGQWLSMARGWQLLPLGALDLGLATVGSYAFLAAGDWLARPRRTRDRAV